MLREYIPRSLRKWIKRQIQNNHQTEKNEVVGDKKRNVDIYLPPPRDSESFVIFKQKKETEKCEQGLPIPPKDLWLGYGKDKDEYLFGNEQVDKMIAIAERSGFDFSDKKILDFGCGAGRMIRWLKPFTETCEIWGTDISAEHINWANQYLRPPFNFATTTTIPHLPFEDRYFDFIYSGSVFTHIDDLADAWLLELRRILKPDGRLYITIQDKHSIHQLETIPVYKQLWLSQFTKKILPEDKDFGVLVGNEGIESQVFYDIDFFCNNVKMIYDVISINNDAYGFQTGILMKRK